jgi:hypothetical protein
MRIQETDRILKESRHARHAAATTEDEGFFSRALKAVTSLPRRIFRHH